MKGWFDLVNCQSRCYKRFQEALSKLASKHKLKLMNVQNNPISFALDLNNLLELKTVDDKDQPSEKEILAHITQIGSHLFTQGCSGVR